MRFSAPLLTVAGTVAGTAAAFVAYQSTASVGATTEPAADKTDEATQTTTHWLPCERGWKLVGNTCVKVTDHVVVVRDLPAPGSGSQEAGRSSGGVAGSAGDDLGDDDADEVEQGDDDASEAGDDDEFEDESGEDADHADEDAPDHEDVGDDD